GADLPLEPHYPPARLAGMLADTGARIVLTRSDWRHALPEGAVECLCLDADWDHLPADEADLPDAGGPDRLAYVIYTSGSTGAPKGVAVTHRAILRLVVNADYAALTPSDVVAQASNTSFDAATFEIWAPLAAGGRLVVVPTGTLLAPRELDEEIRRRGITTMFVTTALFNRIAEEHPRAFASLKHLLFGGEASDPAAVAKVLAEGRPQRLVHVYGPTEANTFATWHEVKGIYDGEATVPIGRPIANTTVYVLDDALNPVPLGVRGQLCIGGPGVARGYLNDPALTARRFVPDPWNPQGRLYLTGDVVRRHSDGDIEWLARRDEQVKIRGFRVEPGEVESALRGLAGVREAVVVARADESGAKGLVAYVAAAPGATREQLRDELAQRLPSYMIPSAFVLMDRLPLTPNGKVDRGALPAPAIGSGQDAPRFRAPRNGLERELTAIWQDVLGVEPIGLDQNFFDDLGGHSLLAVRLFARIEKQLGRKLPIAALFDSPTVESLAAVLEREGWSGQALPAVTLCRQGLGLPFFCVTPMDAFAYLDLARAMGAHRPFHVLHPLAVVDAHEPVVDIEALADHYVAQVRAIQPEGPYMLGGYSVGGVIAYETACRLQRQGQRVAALVLFDAWCPPHGLSARLNRLVRWRIIRYARTFLRLPGRDKLAYLLNAFRPRARRELLQRAAGRVYVNDEDPVARYWRPFHAAYKAACRRYVPGPFAGRPVQFLCSKEPMELIDPRRLWGRVASAGLALCRIRGDHRVMLQAPLVQAVADELNAILAEAESAASGPGGRVSREAPASPGTP
ncbi:MAG: amino acid adenylation domain-containing protein, partial [Planctomycetota bacterium]|nr:amino acid adenylation domain-containing protein [Planctomycetota bacterium]